MFQFQLINIVPDTLCISDFITDKSGVEVPDLVSFSEVFQM